MTDAEKIMLQILAHEEAHAEELKRLRTLSMEERSAMSPPSLPESWKRWASTTLVRERLVEIFGPRDPRIPACDELVARTPLE